MVSCVYLLDFFKDHWIISFQCNEIRIYYSKGFLNFGEMNTLLRFNVIILVSGSG